jgi:uncharacterized protein HemX
MESVPMGLDPSMPRIEESSASAEDSSEDPTTTNNESENAPSTTTEISIARAETKFVKRSKWVVYLVLLLAAGAMGTATYIFTSNQEENQFEHDVSSSIRKFGTGYILAC